MNARFLALFILLFVVSFTLHAESSSKTPVVSETISAHSKIDLNTADINQLTGSFKGIGRKKAEKIIAYREDHHGFKSLEEFGEIKGFGPHFMENNREQLNETFAVSSLVK